MKKRILLTLSVLLCLLCLFALTACEETPEEPAPEEPAPETPAPETPAPETPAHTHAWGEWVVTTPATCTTKGVKVRVCACGESETVYINELGHASSNIWTSNRMYHCYTCTRMGCGVTFNKAEHTYDEENNCIECLYYNDFSLEFTMQNSGAYSGTYAVTDCAGWAGDAMIIIPAKYNGVAVTRIENSAFYGCAHLTSITIPASVMSIGNNAFYNCTELTSVTIPASVTSIGNSAFAYCDSLTSVTISMGVTKIGDSTFSSTGLTSVTIPASVTSIGDETFYGCSGLTSITVASGNTKYHSAGNCLIETATGTLVLGCKNSVIPTDGSVTSIGNYAFSGCTGLTTITIPASVTSIGSRAFKGCDNLASVTIPASVTSIWNYAFDGCRNLVSVIFKNPNNWRHATSYTTVGGTSFFASELANDVTAAIYLTQSFSSSGHAECYWYRT